MKRFALQRRTLAVLAVLVPLAALLGYVALRSGPLAPVAVTEALAERRALQPAVFGIGTVEARHTLRIGPTVAGRVQQVNVDVGEHVRAGQLLAAMEPVDLQERIHAQAAALQRSDANVREAQARQQFAATQAQRYAELWAARSTSEETLAMRRQELQVAEAALAAARQERARVHADGSALQAQRAHLLLRAPQDGLVIAREAEPGSTVVAGQNVLQLVPPDSLWIHLRVDQVSAQGLAAGLPARIHLRSRPHEALAGRVLRIEPRADAVTEELLAKVVFEHTPKPLPPLGELAEVTLALPALPEGVSIPAAALQRSPGAARSRSASYGVWQRSAEGQRLRWVPVTPGQADLEGHVQVLQGLQEGDAVVVHSEQPLHAQSRVYVASQLTRGRP